MGDSFWQLSLEGLCAVEKLLECSIVSIGEDEKRRCASSGDRTDNCKVFASTLSATRMMERTRLRGRVPLSNVRRVHRGPSSDKTLLQTYRTANTLSLQITFLPINFTLTSFHAHLSCYLNLPDTVPGAGERRKGINITPMLIRLRKRQHWDRSGETGVAEGGKTGSPPLI